MVAESIRWWRKVCDYWVQSLWHEAMPNAASARGNLVTFQHYHIYLFNPRRKENLLSTTNWNFLISTTALFTFHNSTFLFSTPANVYFQLNYNFLLSAPQYFRFPLITIDIFIKTLFSRSKIRRYLWCYFPLVED